MSVTLADVAKRAGLARGTVSRILNDRPNRRDSYIPVETRERVKAVAKELGYLPNAAALRLSRAGERGLHRAWDDAMERAASMPRTDLVLPDGTRLQTGLMDQATVATLLLGGAEPAKENPL